MTLNLLVSPQMHSDFIPRITVIGVGGGGTNAVDNMIAMDLQGVEFVVANTDAQQLMRSRAQLRVQLGPHITQGLGAGANPEVGKSAAEEAADELERHLEGAHMVFITAGMGGGTGTGAAPVIARMAKERGILTVGVVTKPFTFEGNRRARAADSGIEELQRFVDTLIVIPNQNLFRMANDRTSWQDAFKMADNVLYMGVRGVTDLMMMPGIVNLDFNDIRTVMREAGKAMMGTGESEGDNRAVRAAEAAISNPLLEDTSMAGAQGLLINITGGPDMTLFEVDEAANRIRKEVDDDANIIFGSAVDEALSGKIRVSVVATGIDKQARIAERVKLVAVPGGGAPVPAIGPQTPPSPGDSVHRSVPNGGAQGLSPQGGSPSAPVQQPGMRPAAPVPGAAPGLRPAAPPPRSPAGAPTQSQPQTYSLAGSTRGSGAAVHQLNPADAEPQPAAFEPASYPEPRTATPAQPLRQPVPGGTPSLPGRSAVSRFAGEGRPATRDNSLFVPEPDAPPPPSRSLFSRVTATLRGGHREPAPPAHGGDRGAAAPRDYVELPEDRLPDQEDPQAPIPNFLLRQVNPTRTR